MKTTDVPGARQFNRARAGGFFQCQKCGLVWFGRDDIPKCPDGHSYAVHVAILCRTCDLRSLQHIWLTKITFDVRIANRVAIPESRITVWA
jgi:hypothetical protein